MPALSMFTGLLSECKVKKAVSIINRIFMLYMAIMKLLLRWMARFWKVVFRFANAKCLKAGWLFMKMN